MGYTPMTAQVDQQPIWVFTPTATLRGASWKMWARPRWQLGASLQWDLLRWPPKRVNSLPRVVPGRPTWQRNFEAGSFPTQV